MRAASADAGSNPHCGGRWPKHAEQPADKDVQDEKKRAGKRSLAKAQRLKIIARLRAEGADDLADPLDACGAPFILTCACCGTQRETVTHCKKRWCPECAPMLSALRYTKWVHAISLLQWPLFVTLTIPNSEDPECLTALKKHWGKFRRRKIIASRVAGGVASFEITNKGAGWHPHIHAVMDCEWLSVHVPKPMRWESKAAKEQKCELAKRELSAAWANQIGNKHGICWVRRVFGHGVVREILKYSVKGSELLDSPEPIAPMLEVLRRSRTLAGFGSLHPLPSPDEEQPMAVACETCGAEKSFLPEEIVKFLYKGSRPGPGAHSRNHHDQP